jgi:hypothetical protein
MQNFARSGIPGIKKDSASTQDIQARPTKHIDQPVTHFRLSQPHGTK